MPLYEYECSTCGHRFEKIQKFSDPPIEACPNCGATPRKLLSSPAIQFKGSGWYITDYARKDSGAPTKAESKDAAPADSKASPASTDASGSTAPSGTSSPSTKSD